MSGARQDAGGFTFTRDNIKGLLSVHQRSIINWIDGAHVQHASNSYINHVLLQNVFTASVDTSSVTMVWAMAELIRRPAMLRKVQEEIRAAVGGGKERVQADDMPKLRYLKMVVKETLRLHPAVPLLLPRETLRHVGICGYDVPARTRVLVNAWAIARDPASWPDEPGAAAQEALRPQRAGQIGRAHV